MSKKTHLGYTCILWFASALLLSAGTLSASDPRIPESNVEEMGVLKETVPASEKAEQEKAGEKGSCVQSDEAFCFLDNRFQVQVEWLNFSSQTGVGHVVDQPLSDNSGVFWFFTDGNWEMLVKVLDGCELNDRFWVFSAATTNVQYTLTVTDTQTGAQVVYTNPLGNAAAALTDTDALATCGS